MIHVGKVHKNEEITKMQDQGQKVDKCETNATKAVGQSLKVEILNH